MLRDESVCVHDVGTFEASSTSWKEIDRALRKIATRRAALDAEEARWIREAMRAEIWLELGMVSMLEYLEARLGYGPRAAQDRIRVALALDALPLLTSSLERGELPFTAVRELTRVATAKTEHAWREAARDKNVHEIEELVSGHAPGDLPSDPPRADLRLRTLSFAVRPETFAKVRQVQQLLEEEAGMRFDDDQLLSALCDAVLAPNDRAPHQVVTFVCASCTHAEQQAPGKRFAIGRAALARVECDAQRIDPITQRANSDIPPKTRRFVLDRDGHCCRVPGCRSTRYLHLHHLVPRSQGGNHDPENLIALCGGHHRAHHDGNLLLSGTASRLAFHAHVGVDDPHEADFLRSAVRP
jgi:hypothetical protein